MRREKKRKKVDSGAAGEGWRAAGDGIGAWMPTEGAGPSPVRRPPSSAVLAGRLVRDKSKTKTAPRFMVLFNMHSNLFCTVSTFAPFRRWWCCWLWWCCWREGLQAIPPPFVCMVGTIRRFSLQKFFFGFRVALGLCRLAKLTAYIIEFVQIDRGWDGKLFVLSCGFKGF